MNRQLLESAKSAELPAIPTDGLDKIVIPRATARAIIEHGRAIRRQNDCSEGTQHAALESIPHVVDALTSMWGYHECSNYLRKLMVVDTVRHHRRGFSRDVFDELAFLYRLIQDNRGSLITETMPRIQRDELKQRERLMRVESAYLRRS